VNRSARPEAAEAAAAEVDPAVDLEGTDLPAMLGSAATPAARESAIAPDPAHALREIWGLSWP
jgi:hypothetical protein